MNRKPLVLVSLLLAAFVINLDTTIVNVALPTLVRELHASNSQLQWVVDAFELVVRGVGAGGGQPLGPVRAQGNAARRPVGLRRGQCAGWPDRRSEPVDRGSRGDGRGRGDGVPFDAVAANERVHRAARARAGHWPVGSDHWCGHRARGRSSAARCSSCPTGGASSSPWPPSLPSPASWSPGMFRPPRPRAPTPTGPGSPAGFALSAAMVGLLVYTIIEAPAHGWGSARARSPASCRPRLWRRRSWHGSGGPSSRCST